jgi:hypothetical protein
MTRVCDSDTVLGEIGHHAALVPYDDAPAKLIFANGTRGTVTGLHHGVHIKFENDDFECNWPAHLLKKYILPAYAMTIHKSQGSEFKHGIVVIEQQHYQYRSSLYTGITRFKRECVVLGVKASVQAAINAGQNPTFKDMMADLLDN